MNGNGEHPLIRITRTGALWALATGAVLFGGLSLFLAYVGTLLMKLSVLASTIVAVFGVRGYRVFPFGRLFSNRTQTHLKDPVLEPFVTTLEDQKRRYLPMVSLVWLLIESAVGVVGFFDPPRLTSVIANVGHVFDLLEPWPRIQLVSDWVLIAAAVGGVGLIGAATIFWLSFHLFALHGRRCHA